MEIQDKPAIPSSILRTVAREFSGRLFAKISVEKITADAAESELKRALGAMDLTALGVGMIIGAGIFVLTGTAAAYNAGPAVVLSFAIAAISSLFAGLCYAEMASIIPLSGSAYSYSYATMGSLVGWTIGWDLILKYLTSAATVSVGWSAYLKSCFSAFGVHFSDEWSSPPIGFDQQTGQFTSTGNIINLPALLIVVFITLIAIIGIDNSARVNAVIVVIKLFVILIFIVVMTPKVDPSNWDPFVPPNQGIFGQYGLSGIFQGALLVFFSYSGFDSISSFALECHDPKRDIPVAIFASLGICAVLYNVVALIATGLIPYDQYKGVAHPISYAVEQFPGYTWLVIIVNFGALAGLASVLLCNLLTQPRIMYSMSIDGFLPNCFATIHPKYNTPWISTFVNGYFCAFLAGFLPIEVLGEIASIGSSFAFMLVSLGVIILRYQRPDLERKFQVPFGPWFIPGLGVLTNLSLLVSATARTIYGLFIWMNIGWIVYFSYGFDKSHKNRNVDMERFRQNGYNPGQIAQIELQHPKTNTPSPELCLS